MNILKKSVTIILTAAMVLSLLAGCGKKEETAKNENAADTKTAQSTEVKEDTAETDVSESKEEPVKEAKVPGHYDLWTMGMGTGEMWTELAHEEMTMKGYVFLEEDHTGKMNMNVSGTEASDTDIKWSDDGNVEVFGQNMYTWEVDGDVLTLTMDGNTVKYYYVREGLDGGKTWQAFKQQKGVTDDGELMADAGEDVDYDSAPADVVPADTMFKVCAVDMGGTRLTGADLAKGGYDKYWVQSGAGGEVDFDLGTGDLHDGSYFLDDVYGAITKYTETTDPMYPYGVASDGDILFVKTRSDTFILARDGIDADEALKKAGDTPNLKIKSGDVPEGLTGFNPTPRDKKYPAVGGNIYFDPANGHIDYIEPDVTEIDYPRGYEGIGLWEIKFGLYDANKLKIFHCSPDMFPVYIDEKTGKYNQDIYATKAGLGCAALGHAMFCHTDKAPAATDSLGSIEYFEYGPAFINANLADYQALIGSLSKDAKDYKLKSGKDEDIKKLAEYVVEGDKDGARALERIGKFVRADYIYDPETGRYDTKHADEAQVKKKEEIRKTLKGHGLYNEGRAYLMRDLCVASGIPCVTLILGNTDVYGEVYKSYDEYYNKNHVELTRSRHADDYENEEIDEDIQEQIDAVKNAAPMCAVYDLAWADGKWHLIDGNGVTDLGKGAGPNGTFMRYQILEADGENVEHVDRQKYYKEVYDMQQDYNKKAIAKGELPDWSTFDHVLDDSGTYYLYDGVDEKGNVTKPEDTKGKKEAWVKLNMDGTGELEWFGFHSKVSWCSNEGHLTCCSDDAKACASFSGVFASRETRDTSGCRWDGKSREHGISARLLYIKDGEYVEQKFHVLEPYGESMMLYDTDNIEEDGYRYRLLKDQGSEPAAYGKTPF